jgi:hypothetical protein
MTTLQFSGSTRHDAHCKQIDNEQTFFIENTIMSYLPTNAKYIMRIGNRQTRANVCYREYSTTTVKQCIKDYIFLTTDYKLLS